MHSSTHNNRTRTGTRSQSRRVFIAAVTAAMLQVARMDAATMQLASTNVASGANVSVPVTINNTSGALGDYAVTVSFDTNVVRFGSVLGGNGQFAAAPAVVTTNVPGQVRYVHQQTVSITAPTGTVMVSQINFTAIGAAGSSSTLRLSNASADNTDGQTIPVTGLTDGSVQIGGSQQLLVSPASNNFSTIATGTTAQITLTVSNTGVAVLSGSANVGAPFGIVSGSPFNLSGGASTILVVSFTPPAATSYNANVIFTSTAGNSTNSVSGTGAIVPVAAFSANQTAGAASLPVNFTDTSSGTVTNRIWSFGDGATTNIIGTSISHTYTQAGTYTVGLTVAGPVGSDTLSKPNYITVTNIVVTTYTISTSASPTTGGSTSGGGSKPAGATVTVTAAANAGYSFVNWTEVGTEVSTSPIYTFTASSSRTLVANYTADPPTNSTIQITMAPTVTNALLRVGNTAVVAADESNVFTVGAVSSTGLPLYYTWQFGDGTNSSRSSANTTAHVYPPVCSNYTASVSVDDGTATSDTNLTVSVACALEIDKLQAKPNFARANGDSGRLTATLDLGADFTPAGMLVTLNISGAQVSFALDTKGKGMNEQGTCSLKFNKKTNDWRMTVKLKAGNWQTAWAEAGLVNADVAKPGAPVTLTVVVLVDREGFAANKTLLYTATAGKSGSAK
jgi:PKD repeat protein